MHIYTVTALGRGRVASPTLGRTYPQHSFYRRLSGPQGQSGHGVKKNLHPSDTQDQTQAIEAHGRCGCKGAHTYVYTVRALRKGRVASPTLGRLYQRYSFYSRLSGPQEQSGY